jgi:AhpD family alkylhydroperoxidase
MALYPFVEEAAASAEVRAVYEDIKATRKVDWINNFWKVLANNPASLKQTWTSLKQIMTPGALDARTKEMLYLAVSISNGCDYCTVSHTAAARKAGMTDAMLHELIAVVGMANETNRVVQAYRVEPDEKLVEAAKGPKG